jgi:glutamine amidotransferase
VATRYITSRTSEASSLFFSSGTSFEEYQEGGLYRMTKADKRESIIMIASEPLTFERNEWMEVKTNTMIVITPKVGMCPDSQVPKLIGQMNLLQIPIIDEYWVPPQDPASHNRSTDFAISMGFGEPFHACFALTILIHQATDLHPPRPAPRSLRSARSHACTRLYSD